MIRPLLCTALLACSSASIAADWKREFFSPMTNELPPARGVAVDDLGHVHLQAFNRLAGSKDYVFAHQYTIDAQGYIPWIWGLSQVDRMSDCGVYAKSGQRLDCTRTTGWSGDETRLEMRSRHGSYPVWQTALPPEAQLLDASIPVENEALIVAAIDGPFAAELGVFRAAGHGPAEVLSVVPACPMPGQRASLSRLRMPRDANEPILHIKVCPTGFGPAELIAERFDRFNGQWSTLSNWNLPFGATVTHAAMTVDGKGFALIDHGGGFRELLAHGVFGDAWLPMPLPGDQPVATLVADERALVVALEGQAPDRTDVENLIRFDLQGGFWPQFMPTPALSGYDAEVFALSGEGALLVVGRDPAQRLPSQQLLSIDRFGQHHLVAALPLTRQETALGAPYLLPGPGNVAVVARTIVLDEGFDNPQTGVRVNQYDLPMTP